ncbi:DegT/DnrJ/EryC1/StrS family aminotransferase [Paenibacillus sp. FSL H8-0034]|uniref:DegT/DnrJ/EryC1/StrS family aminotransferase n=1 Tax=Paenibacillus sp. FSL H8-0034 TaxID=2954671 RepID=UPI0030F627AA
MEKFHNVAQPILNGNEKKYVMDCLDSTWISSNGSYIHKFEQEFAQFVQTQHAIACSNGTTALHLALMGHGVTEHDEVIVPSFTFVATANAVAHCGATPVFVDAEPDTWNMNPLFIEEKITPRTKGIIAVHLYGHPADMDPIMAIADKYGLFVIEDAAEATGAEYKGKKVGSIGHSAIFSLFGNKIITTGEGGIVTTNDGEFTQRIRLLKGQGMDPNRRYWHPVIGYNYRMTNIQAAIGCAQLENIQWHIEQRIRIAGLYKDQLQSCPALTMPVQKDWAKNVYWLFSVLLNDVTEAQRDELIERLVRLGIETRPFFHPMHALPPYQHLQPHSEFPVANRISSQGINLPSSGNLTDEEIHFISDSFKKVLAEVLHN